MMRRIILVSGACIVVAPFTFQRNFIWECISNFEVRLITNSMQQRRQESNFLYYLRSRQYLKIHYGVGNHITTDIFVLENHNDKKVENLSQMKYPCGPILAIDGHDFNNRSIESVLKQRILSTDSGTSLLCKILDKIVTFYRWDDFNTISWNEHIIIESFKEISKLESVKSTDTRILPVIIFSHFNFHNHVPNSVGASNNILQKNIIFLTSLVTTNHVTNSSPLATVVLCTNSATLSKDLTEVSRIQVPSHDTSIQQEKDYADNQSSATVPTASEMSNIPLSLHHVLSECIVTPSPINFMWGQEHSSDKTVSISTNDNGQDEQFFVPSDTALAALSQLVGGKSSVLVALLEFLSATTDTELQRALSTKERPSEHLPPVDINKEADIGSDILSVRSRVLNCIQTSDTVGHLHDLLGYSKAREPALQHAVPLTTTIKLSNEQQLLLYQMALDMLETSATVWTFPQLTEFCEARDVSPADVEDLFRKSCLLLVPAKSSTNSAGTEVREYVIQVDTLENINPYKDCNMTIPNSFLLAMWATLMIEDADSRAGIHAAMKARIAEAKLMKDLSELYQSGQRLSRELHDHMCIRNELGRACSPETLRTDKSLRQACIATALDLVARERRLVADVLEMQRQQTQLTDTAHKLLSMQHTQEKHIHSNSDIDSLVSGVTAMSEELRITLTEEKLGRPAIHLPVDFTTPGRTVWGGDWQAPALLVVVILSTMICFLKD